MKKIGKKTINIMGKKDKGKGNKKKKRIEENGKGRGKNGIRKKMK